MPEKPFRKDRSSRRTIRSYRRAASGAFALLHVASAWLAAPAPVLAQLEPLETLAERVSDVSFYFRRGTLVGSSPELRDETFSLTSFGVEVLFEVGEITRPSERAALPAQGDSVRRVLTEMEVVRSGERVDTVYRYRIEPVVAEPPPLDTVWSLELGVGYGQLQGLEFRDEALDLSASVRDVPSLSLYVSFDPWGSYFGFRTGYMRAGDLQAADAGGHTFSGHADAFLVGTLLGHAVAAGPLWLFLEGGYTHRSFPSVRWEGDTPLPAGLPRELDVSGWFVGTGIQFPFR